MARRHYTPDLANRSLPLVRAIATDIQAVAQEMQAVFLRLRDAVDEAQREALRPEFERLGRRFEELVGELEQMGVELKDPMTGLLDFRARRGDQEVYLCWRLGEPAVGHWHPLETGFAGRRSLAEF